MSSNLSVISNVISNGILARNFLRGGLGIFLLLLPLSLFGQKPSPGSLYRSGKYDEAITLGTSLLETIPRGSTERRIQIYAVLGWAFLSKNQLREAEKYAILANKERNQDFRIEGIWGDALYRMNREEEALEHLRNYIRLRPLGADVGYMYSLIGSIYEKQGLDRYAEIAYTSAVSLEKNVKGTRILSWWIALGKIREKLELNESALVAYRSAQKIQPKNTEVLSALVRLQQSGTRTT